MLVLLALCAGLSLSSAMVCLPGFCDHIEQPVLDCKGGIIQHAGFCGFYNFCARIEGEACIAEMHIRGVPNTAICDEGLECAPFLVDGTEQGHRCVKKSEKPVAQRLVSPCETACQRQSLLCTISMVVYQGQWFAKCDQQGNFLPQQCDNTNHCFCVDPITGVVQQGTKVLGSANC
ncbi:unnamed protein product [Lymnaea stagnalis]|uniref:Thyroglobulin type-1 domain-containing protein n=1 Tax=Lymnaea stagnalis TaxID=6523 RepID=A0AAV2IJ52_LYMST